MSQEGFLAFAGVAASFFRVSRSAARRGDGAALGAQEERRRRIFYYVRGDGVIADTPLWVYCLCARPPCAASSERRVLERCDIEQLRAVSLCPYSASKWLGTAACAHAYLGKFPAANPCICSVRACSNNGRSINDACAVFHRGTPHARHDHACIVQHCSKTSLKLSYSSAK